MIHAVVDTLAPTLASITIYWNVEGVEHSYVEILRIASQETISPGLGLTPPRVLHKGCIHKAMAAAVDKWKDEGCPPKTSFNLDGYADYRMERGVGWVPTHQVGLVIQG